MICPPTPAIYTPERFATQFGEVQCGGNRALWFGVGAATLYFLPVILSGIIQGGQDYYQETRGGRRRRK